jgi:16S rRNA pseudouridine516 synthase
MTMRLDKLLGHTGWGSRKQIKELCKGGTVTVDGTVIRDSAVQVDPDRQQIAVGNDVVCYANHYYMMMNKPAGVLSATTDRFSQTVLDLLPRQYSGAGMFPVGRLDKDTTGLLLLTNDGSWAHRITSPKKHIDKVYEAVVDGVIPADIEEQFRCGIVLDDGLECLPARAVITAPQQLDIVVQEGKFHQVKRMCAAVGLTVTALHRRSIGALVLDAALEPGTFRSLTDQERDLPFST